jgi:hypothetical protein
MKWTTPFSSIWSGQGARSTTFPFVSMMGVWMMQERTRSMMDRRLVARYGALIYGPNLLDLLKKTGKGQAEKMFLRTEMEI